jgi:multiple sugar transport system ATP-binding protein
VLQQVYTPRELYTNPKNLFVAGFIGSPAMNFFEGELGSGGVRTPIGELPLTDELRREAESGGGGRRVIVGVRPEDFEDASLVDTGKHGFEFEAPIELTESMGSEIYAHFGIEGEGVRSDELQELAEDAGIGDVPGSGQVTRAVARLDPTSRARPGERLRLWVDTAKIHLFDAHDGHSLRAGAGAATPTVAPAESA